jgi:hypothetical protein
MPTPEVEKIPDWIKAVFMGVVVLGSIRIEYKLRKIEKLVKEKEEREGVTRDGEPVPSNLSTATQGQTAI